MRLTASAVLLALAMLCAPVSAGAAAPGVDEYTPTAPSAGGHGNVTSDPVARPEDLPPSVRDALAKRPDGSELTKIATARELGAPGRAGSPSETGTEENRALPAAVVHAVGGPGWILLGIALAAIGAFAFGKRRDHVPADS